MNNHYKKSRQKQAVSKTVGVVAIIIIVIAAIGVIYYETSNHSVPSTSSVSTTPTSSTSPVVSSTTSSSVSALSVAPSSQIQTQGLPLSVTVYNAQSGATLEYFFGDGTSLNSTSTTVNHNYTIPGHYLILVNELQNGQMISTTSTSLQSVVITPYLNSSLAQLVSIPVITFNISRNPSAPVVNVGQKVYLLGGYLEAPSGQNMTINEYIWNFGNGETMTVKANQTTLQPEVNPVNVTYNSPGLYTVVLTIQTLNVSNNKTYDFSVAQTVAVASAAEPFNVYKFQGSIPNPGVITVAENVPGGPYSFDPSIDYESVGFEVVSNIFATLVIYNGSSTTSFLPYVADNWTISNNDTVYTFHIRPDLKFSNGDPLTAYDVWYSVIRTMLFAGGSPGTSGWILTQYLIPNYVPFTSVVNSSDPQAGFNTIMNAVTYNNQTDTVTFHLVKPTPPQLFFTAVADPLGAGIQDAKFLESVGAGITFTPNGFLQYQQQGNEGDYNTQVQFNPVTSGPYTIKEYVPGQSIVLVPNPYYPGVPSIPKPNDTVVIEWVKDPSTAYNLFASGQADIVTGLPTNYFPLLKQLEAQGQASLYEFPTLSEFFFVFNLNVSQSGLKQLNPSYHIPANYFANLDVRKAFAYAFNYSEYINDIVGNQKYGFDFANPYAGVIIPGLPYYVPPSQLQNVPTFNLTYAKQLLEQSGEYNVSVYFPIIISSGDTVDYEAAQMWAQALNSIDPNIQATPMYEPFSTIIAQEVPGQNPMPVFYLGWIADYPYPSDFINAMYEQGGTYPGALGWNVTYLQQIGHPNQAKEYAELNQLIQEADSATNPTQAAQLYKQAEQLAINLYMYVYTQQPNSFWVVKPYMTGYNGQISYEENPMIGGAGDSLYFWWVKG